MAILLLPHPVELPVTRLRHALAGHMPEISWRIGDDDDGSDQPSIPFERTQTILGRGGETMLMIALEPRHERYLVDDRPAPPHEMHLRIGRPTLADEAAAHSLSLIVAAILAGCVERDVWLQVEAGENWLGAADLQALVPVADTDPAGLRTGALIAPHRLDQATRTGTLPLGAARPGLQALRRPGGFGRKGL